VLLPGHEGVRGASERETAQRPQKRRLHILPLLVNNCKDVVKDHCHITRKYRGAGHNACNLKLCLKPKTTPIPVVFHNLKGYDGHLLMQAMARVQGEISGIPNNREIHLLFAWKPEV